MGESIAAAGWKSLALRRNADARTDVANAQINAIQSQQPRVVEPQKTQQDYAALVPETPGYEQTVRARMDAEAKAAEEAAAAEKAAQEAQAQKKPAGNPSIPANRKRMLYKGVSSNNSLGGTSSTLG